MINERNIFMNGFFFPKTVALLEINILRGFQVENKLKSNEMNGRTATSSIGFGDALGIISVISC